MARRRVTVSIGDDVLRALDDAARRSGETRSRLVERTLARQLIGTKVEQLRGGSELGEDEATALAYEELRASRATRNAKRAAS